MKPPALAAAMLCCAFAATPAAATDIVFRFLNPSFGGDPLNGPNLLNSANAQNKKTDPSAPGAAQASGQRSALQQFNDSLQRAILSRISSSVSSNLFDASGNLVPGVVDTADFRIAIADLGGGMLRITTVDKLSGQSTSFEVSQ